MKKNRKSFAAVIFAALMALLLAAGAALDPSGIFTWIGWTGSPVAALWWWAPYVIYAPAVLLLSFVGADASLLTASSRGQAWRRLWAVAVLATAAAELLYSVALLAPMVANGRYVIPLGSTFAFLLWNTGYAGLKMGLFGWLPAGLAVLFHRPEPQREDMQRRNTQALAIFVAGGSALVCAALGPWLAQSWWQGSPLGYAYRPDATLFAPTPASGWAHWMASLLLLTVLLGWQILRRTRPTIAAARAVFVLLLIQALALLLQAGTRAPDHDLWNLPALFVRSVESSSFALLFAMIAGAVAFVAHRLHARRLKWGGIQMAVLSLVVVAVLTANFGGVGPLLAAPELATQLTVPQAGTLPRLRVGANAQISDEQGARVILRGVNVNQLGEYFKRDPKLPSSQPLIEQDFADIASLGMNMVRLTLSWSLLEPEQGHVSAAYLDRIRQAVSWAKAHGVYVLLDIHQDAWGVHVDARAGTECRSGTSPMVGWDGAPAWATLTDGTAPCQVTGRDLAPNVSRAFQSFYMDRADIQSSLVKAWGALAEAFADDSTVIGYDLINEPNFGESPPIASTLLLANYHARSIEAIRRAEAAHNGGFQHIVFFEPSVIWSGFGIDNLPPRRFTPDTQTVFSPHLYNESISADQDFGLTLVSVERGYALARAAAEQLGTPLWIGEWGYFGDQPKNVPLMKRQLAAEDGLNIGSAFWIWKQGCSDPHAYPSPVAGNVRRLSCPQMQDIGTATDMTRALTRPYLRRSPDGGARLDGLTVSGSYQVANEAAACAFDWWVPGDAEPQIKSITGAKLGAITRQKPGSEALGGSGGWSVQACLTGGAYKIELR